MRLFKTVAGVRLALPVRGAQSQLGPHARTSARIGLVPTMGALHAGHESLIVRARQENDVVVVSIFVNPLQFEPGADLAEYPRTFDADSQLCQRVGVDVLFVPTVGEMYGDEMQKSDPVQVVPPASMLKVLCAPRRPGHFEGVATVVTKLLAIVAPTVAYFGEKDAQQLAIIRRLVADLKLPTEIRGCAIVREASGLAYSSRNRYLTPQQKQQAALISQSLFRARRQFQAGERVAIALIATAKELLLSEPEIAVEYVELVHPETLVPLEQVEDKALLAIAARVGAARLIDNVILYGRRRPIVAIDGPAGAGKSTVTRRVARSLGLLHLDTGAMYRALTWAVMEAKIPLDDEAAIAELASLTRIQLIATDSPQTPVRVCVNEEDVTEEIRTREVSSTVSQIAAQKAVREELVERQRSWAKKGGVVAEGRDIGTHVFPDAELKIFLTASVAERARRRLDELQARGIKGLSLEQLERDIQQRDAYDSSRAVSPLRRAVDAVEIQTDDLEIEQVVEAIVELYWQKVN